MMRVDIGDLPSLCLVRSDRLLDLLVDARIGAGSFPDADKIRTEITKTIDEIQPNTFRKDSVRQELETLRDSLGQEPYNLNCLIDLFHKYYVFNGSSIMLSPDRDIGRAERAMALAARLHPAAVFGAKLARLLGDGIIELDDVHQYARSTLPLGMPPPTGGWTLVDNHIHWNGANEPSLALLELARVPRRIRKKNADAHLPYLSDMPIINTGRLTLDMVIDLLRVALLEVERLTFFPDDAGSADLQCEFNALYCSARSPDSFGIDLTAYVRGDLATSGDFTARDPAAALLRMALDEMEYDCAANGLLLYFTFLNTVVAKPNHPAGIAARIAFHALNIVRSYMVMSRNIGLSNFIDFYNAKPRHAAHRQPTYHHEIARGLVGTGVESINIKIGGRDKATAYRKEIIEISRSIIVQNKKFYRNIGLNMSNIQFTVHFIRQVDPHEQSNEPPSAPPGHYIYRKKLLKEALALEEFLYNPSLHMVSPEELGLSCEEVEAGDINLSNMVTAIDAAGRETATPPEVYAPVFRYLRRRVVDTTQFRLRGKAVGVIGERHRRLRIAVHAGEDFPSLLTGIRRVDETIRYYDMGPGDSLGHGLAIGINPADFRQLGPPNVMTWGELIDDLVWLRQRLIDISSLWKDAIGQAMIVDGLARRLWEQFMLKYYKGNVDFPSISFDPDIWYRAWELRRHCPLVSPFEELPSLYEYSTCNKLQHQSNTDLDNAAVAHHLYASSSSYRHCLSKTISGIKFDGTQGDDLSSLLRDIIKFTGSDDLLEAIQDYIIDLCRKREIYVEVCPTSNIVIGYFDSYSQHPLFRWRPVESGDLRAGERFNRFGIRHGPIKICINTDDPGIFATSLENELSLIKRATPSDDYNAIDLWMKFLAEGGENLIRGGRS